jgi:hypothetical protein
MGTSDGNQRPAEPARADLRPTVRGAACDLYAPGHQMHYRHQGNAVRSRSRTVANAFVDDSLVILVLDDGIELRWRHHDPDRLRRLLEAVPTKRVAYPDQHALRVGPYWFNCAREDDDWQDCRTLSR